MAGGLGLFRFQQRAFEQKVHGNGCDYTSEYIFEQRAEIDIAIG